MINLGNYKYFVNTLQTASSQGLYVSQTDDGFASYADKKTKNLKTSEIAALVEDCFNHYQNPEFSEKKKAALMKDLRISIKYYRYRLYQSKKWYEQVGSLFGFMSQEEKRLKAVATKTHKHKNKVFAETENVWKKFYQNHLKDPKIQTRKFAIKVLEAKDFPEKPKNDNTSAGLGITSYLEDLRAFPHQTEQVIKAIALLEDALSLQILALTGTFPLVTNGPSLKSTLSEYYKRLNENIDSLEIGEQTIFVGTVSDGAELGHGILYQIERRDETNYALSVFNSQLDVEEFRHLTAKSREPVTLENLSSFLVKHRIKKKTLRVHVERDFFDHHFIQNTCKKATTQVEMANEIFLSHLNGLEKSDGKDHAAGTTTSCAFKSISYWLNEMLGTDYQEFKVFLTENELAKQSSLSHVHKNLFLTKGQEVLTHRKQKLTL